MNPTPLTKKQALEKIDELKMFVSGCDECDQKKPELEIKKVKIQIKNRFTGEIIFESEKSTMEEAIVEAIERGANLSDADLSGADLSGANLSGANLIEADLSGANLSGASLRGANLSDADLSGADLSGANLIEADLSRVNLSRADLRDAELYKAIFIGKTVAPEILTKKQVPDFLRALGFKIED